MSNSKRLPHGHDLDPAKHKNKWGLTPKQEQFCHAYLIDFNIAKAERVVGLGEGVGKRMMAREAVRKRISQIRVDTGKALDVTRERILQELMKIIYADAREANNEPDEWSEDFASTVSGMEFDLIGDVKKVTRFDKLRAIELLNRMLGYNMPDVVLNKNTNLNLNTEPIDRKDAVAIAKQLEDLI